MLVMWYITTFPLNLGGFNLILDFKCDIIYKSEGVDDKKYSFLGRSTHLIEFPPLQFTNCSLPASTFQKALK